METILIVITLASVATTIVALTSMQRLRRQERERSDARVSALSAAAQDSEGFSDGKTRVTESTPTPSSGRFFGTVERDEPNSRLPVLAVVALVVTVAGALVFLNTSASNDRAAVEPSQAPPLELMALGHERNAKRLTISGIVRNPAGGLKLDGLTAVVSLLDGRGALLSTRDVPLDYRALGPGEETPFKLSISDPGSLARYRVSFRAGTAVVPHVDRRSPTKLASARE